MGGNCYWGVDDGAPLLDRIQEECETAGFSCPQNDGELQCNVWQTLDDTDGTLFEGCQEGGLTEEQKTEMKAKMQEKRAKWEDMTMEERADLREERKAIRDANAATVLGCGCCEGVESIKALVKDREGAVAKTLRFRKPRGEGGFGQGHGNGHHGGGGRPGAGQGAAGGDGGGD